ncbi:hypothetical protein ACIRFH_27960 [Streptomyces sp. NPDC093586]
MANRFGGATPYLPGGVGAPPLQHADRHGSTETAAPLRIVR